MATPVDIQQIKVDEFETAFFLLKRFFREEDLDTPAGAMRASLHALLLDQSSAVFLAWLEGEAVGVATVSTSLGIEYGRSAELDDLYVLPQARGRGFANTGRLILERDSS